MDHDDTPHPVCVKLLQLRQAAGLSRPDIEAANPAIKAVALRSYERGHREPPLHKLDAILAMYRMRLDVVPIVRGEGQLSEIQEAIYHLSALLDAYTGKADDAA